MKEQLKKKKIHNPTCLGGMGWVCKPILVLSFGISRSSLTTIRRLGQLRKNFHNTSLMPYALLLLLKDVKNINEISYGRGYLSEFLRQMRTYLPEPLR